MKPFDSFRFEEQVRKFQQAHEEQAALRVAEKVAPAPIGNEGSFDLVEYDLSTVFRPLPQKGYGIYFLPDSPPSARLNLKTGGRWTSFAPGQFFEGYFDGVQFERADASVDTGIARLLVLKTPNARAGIFAGLDQSGTQAFIETQNRNNTNNTPSGATDGYPLIGVKRMKVFVGAENGQTLSGGGTLRIWRLLTAGAGGPVSVANNWTLDQDHIISLGADASGQQYVTFPGFENDVPFGRIHVEARSVTSSGGTNLNVVLVVSS